MNTPPDPSPGVPPKERTRGWFAHFQSDWNSFLPGMSWRDFTFVNLRVEWAHYTGRFELQLVLLGLWLVLTYVYDDQTPLLQNLREMRDDFRSRESSDV